MPKNFIKSEKERLAKIGKVFSSKTGFGGVLTDLTYKTFKDFYKGKNCLEIGSADGQGTKHLLKFFKRVVALDGSKKLSDKLRKTLKNKKLEVVSLLAEEYETKEKFDTIVMAHILEHVIDPIKLLKLARSWLKENGIVLVDVPNANSIHRLIGVKIGLLRRATDLNESDIRVGHRRVYTMQKLIHDAKKAGLKIKKTGGIFFKPLSNKQIEETWEKKMIDGFYELGKDFPDLAAEIYIVCSKR
jgi:2-polyprenyl-3-methyl-5-hydroxy-6-metoxy-1,4-benzoquinol methylase